MAFDGENVNIRFLFFFSWLLLSCFLGYIGSAIEMLWVSKHEILWVYIYKCLLISENHEVPGCLFEISSRVVVGLKPYKKSCIIQQ
jgi:hypothetical protein